MTRLEALKELAKKVEAGEFPALYKDLSAAGLAHNSYGIDSGGYAWDAFFGSLDAAKALHEAVLPGWDWRVEENVNGYISHIGPTREEFMPSTMAISHDNSGRAWLSAILRALIAQEESA